MNKILLLGLILFSTSSFANEDASAPPAAAAEAGGHGASVAVQAKPEEWLELINTVATSKGKLDAQRTVVDNLIKEKHESKSSAQTQDVIKRLVVEHKLLNKLIEEYEQHKQLLKYRYPEKGIKEARKYERVETQTLEELENSATVENRIKASVKKAKIKYGIEEKKKPAPEVQKEPVFESSENPAVTDKIIFVK